MPTHTIDLLRCASHISRTTWLTLTHGGRVTEGTCTIVSTDAAHGSLLVQVDHDGQLFVFTAPAVAVELIDPPTRPIPKPATTRPAPPACDTCGAALPASGSCINASCSTAPGTPAAPSDGYDND